MRPAQHNFEEDSVRGFQAAFGRALPTHVSTGPGRVNLIGEHTDYNGLPVFPMALTLGVQVHFRPRNHSLIRVANENPDFQPREFSVSSSISPSPPGDWGNYLKAPCQALARRFGPLSGMDVFVRSSLPVASGLSSSSALVIAMGQALLAANGHSLPTLDMAQEMARAERYTGTQGGGMDQAISLGGLAGHACRIEFDPLTLTQTPIPPDWRFLVAHSLVRAEKSGQAQNAYNLRTRECARALGEVRVALARHLGPEALEFGFPEMTGRIPLMPLLDLAGEHLTGPLLKRFRHVVTEAQRVYGAESAMQEAAPHRFGRLMDESHASLRDDYEVSSPELDALVAQAKDAGALGARLTGAGFGGCVVILTDQAGVSRISDALTRGYYEDRGLAKPSDGVLFEAEAADGAQVRSL